MSHIVPPISKYKLVFLGEIYVGKTSLINRFMYDSFAADYQATIGIDFLSKTMEVEGRTVRLQLWDTAGQERFRSLIPNYIRDSSVAVVVFDVSNRQSFTNVDKWVGDVRNERGVDAVIVLVGNKIDKEDERAVTYEEGCQKAKEISAVYVESSAKTGIKVQEVFDKIIEILPTVESRPSLPLINNEVVSIQRNPQPASPRPAAPAGDTGCKC